MRELPHCAADAFVLEAAVAHRTLLGDGEGSMGGRDDRGPVGRDHPRLRRSGPLRGAPTPPGDPRFPEWAEGPSRVPWSPRRCPRAGRASRRVRTGRPVRPVCRPSRYACPRRDHRYLPSRRERPNSPGSACGSPRRIRTVRFRDSRWWRRCAERRRAPTSPAPFARPPPPRPRASSRARLRLPPPSAAIRTVQVRSDGFAAVADSRRDPSSGAEWGSTMDSRASPARPQPGPAPAPAASGCVPATTPRVSRGQARRSRGCAGREGSGPRPTDCSPLRPGRTRGTVPPRAPPPRTHRTRRSRC